MTRKRMQSVLARRAFLTRLGAGVTGAGSIYAVPAAASAASAAEGPWQPARHDQDNWLDQVPGKHRFMFDAIVPDGLGHALMFANNYYIANRNGYGLQDSDLAVVIVARHHATPYVLNDSIWAKYGEVIAQQFPFADPKTKQAPRINLFNAAGYGAMLPNNGVVLDGLLKRGVQFAVCQMALGFYSGKIAATTGAKSEDVLAQLTSNLMANCHPMAAGILAVNRAQERGYAFVNA